MEQTVLALNRSSSSALLQLQNQLYCPGGGGRGGSRGPACGLAQPGAEVGSLPHTPDSGSPDEERAEPLFPAHDALYPRTYELVRTFIRQHAEGAGQPERDGGGGGSWLSGCGGWARDDERRAADTLDKVGARLIHKHGTAFTGMINRLNISERSDLEAISRVATEMFSDGEVNWGRVASFIAFGAVIGVHLKKIQREDCIDEVAMQVTQYLVQQKREWLETHNGWDGFTKFFHENNAEESTKKALMWIAGFGIAGAGIMHLLR